MLVKQEVCFGNPDTWSLSLVEMYQIKLIVRGTTLLSFSGSSLKPRHDNQREPQTKQNKNQKKTHQNKQTTTKKQKWKQKQKNSKIINWIGDPLAVPVL